MPYKGRVGQSFHQLKKLPSQLLDSSPHSKQMIWLAGVQRSGTNMVMDALDRHTLTRVFHEAEPGVFDDYKLRDNEVVAKRYKATYAKTVVAKALLDADRIAELLACFENSKVVWPTRNFADVINSHVVRWPGFREWIDEIASGGATDNWRGRNISDTVRDILKKLYFPECSVVDCKALFWLCRNQIYFDEQLHTDDRALVIRYEDFVQNPENISRVLVEFAGLDYQSAMIRGIHTRSISKSPPPDMNETIKTACLEMEARLLEQCVRIPLN